MIAINFTAVFCGLWIVVGLQGSNQPFIPLGFGTNRLQDMHDSRSSSASPMRASAANAAPSSSAFGLPGSDTPEIQKYKKRFNTDILCAALWGKFTL